ncbi:macro domain-containing protein (plasmid) [Rhodococcus opacus]|uniref:type II toxin-antitoxin system antitoxin DNA ADP-ribosyl glycohydrolase DarG n=1 Tax=Rhodococcus opacus TaxID=37919 RepID=UPI0034D248CD
MIIESSGDLLKAQTDAIVNTVNCVGIMGKGIALQVKRRYPDVFKVYERACRTGEVRIGAMLPVETGELGSPHWIVNFPTKKHWRSPSQLTYISEGLKDLRRVVEELGLKSIAIPPLGAGNGGLDWSDVEPLIRDAFEASEVDVHLYSPSNARQTVRGGTKRLNMTRVRATVLTLMDHYCERKAAIEPLADKALSHLELQKLVYFADYFDQTLGLKFSQGRYGPYSDVLRIMIRDMEGSFVSGFGDGTDKVLNLRPISITEEGRQRLIDYLDRPDSQPVTDLVDRVMNAIDGYEEPYGVELLASTHWVAVNEGAGTPDLASDAVRSWTQRKGRIFTDRHISIALNQLEHVGALDVP